MTTKEKIAQLISNVDRYNETLCVIYCDEENETGNVGYVGNLASVSNVIAGVLERLCKMEFDDTELGFANTIIQAVAAIDYKTNGGFVKLIKEVEKENLKKKEYELAN